MLRCLSRFHVLIAAFILSSVFLEAEPLELSVSADAAILVNYRTGNVLFEKNSDVLYYPASTTKIATALYALEVKGSALNDRVSADQDSIGSISSKQKRKSNYSFPPYWIEHGSSHIGIKKGEILSFEDVLYGMMVASGNDAANVIAQHVSGSVSVFMDSLNLFLKEIGCVNTGFNNPHGLHHPEHRTTAKDLSVMARRAMKHDLFRKMVLTERYLRPKTNMQEATTLVQTNQLVRANSSYYYSKALGIKTGYTSEAGYNLVAAAQQGDRVLIGVLMRCDQRADSFKDMVNMFEVAFEEEKVQRRIFRQGVQNLTTSVEGAEAPLEASIQEDVLIEYYPSEKPEVKASIVWEVAPLPIQKGQKVGDIFLVSEDGAIRKTVELFANRDLHATWFFTFQRLWVEYGVLGGAMFASLGLGLCAAFWNFRHKRVG